PGFVHVFPLERQFVISFLSGTVHRIAADHLVVLTYGVGRKVHVTPETLASTRHGAEIELVTSLVVREDSLTLYGFGTEDENHTFEVLLTISAIGPRLAMALLSGMGRADPARPIRNRDGAGIELVTSLVVREDSLTLYGFGTEDENHTFEVLLTISGIGPRLAMAILSVMGPDELASAISNQDANALTRVPGIGKKGASRIILELENKLPQPAASAPGPALSFGGGNQQVVDALVGLGWKEQQAEEVVAEVVKDAG